MELEQVRSVLAWCALLNYAVLAVWFAAFALVGDWMHRLHGRWFSIPRETFDAIHYALMGAFKLLVFVFNLAPYLVLRMLA